MNREQITVQAHARAFEALALRKQGLTYREIGERIGVKAERASQLVAKGERLSRQPTETAGLSVRARNYLRQMGISTKAEARNAKLEWAPNAGPVTREEIADWAKAE